MKPLKGVMMRAFLKEMFSDWAFVVSIVAIIIFIWMMST